MISAIVPTRDRLEQTLEAALSLVVIEVIDEIIIIVDDDFEELNRYRNSFEYRGFDNIRILKNDVTPGAQGARICGIMNAKHELIFFLDSDDLALRDGVTMEAQAFLNDPDLALAYSNLVVGDNKSNFLQLDGYCFRVVLKNLSLCPFSGLMVKKSAINLERLNSALPAWQDDDFCLVIAQYGKVKYVSAPAAEYCLSNDSISRSKARQYQGLSQLLDKWRNTLVEEWGYKYLFLWKLRRMALYFSVLSDQDCFAGYRVVSFVCCFKSMVFSIMHKVMIRILRKFFDRCYS